jgi:preprotein translocase SecE subunit
MEIYKRGQGNRARALSSICAGLVVAYGVSEALGTFQAPSSYVFATFIVVLVGGAGVYFPFMHKKTVDFLIDTQAEMKKVAWAPWGEVRGSTGVVITSVVLMAVFLYVVDYALGLLTQLAGIVPM